jgi:hypothetical protein
MGKVSEYFNDRDRRRAPGAAAAVRGCVVQRAWHLDAGAVADMAALSDVLVATPMVRALLGSNVDVRVRVSDSGRGLVFELEPHP